MHPKFTIYQALICLFPIVVFLLFSFTLTAQIFGSSDLAGAELNAIQTAVPFLTIAPDARSGAMGDAGVASSCDINSQNWNVAKYLFAEKASGISISYTPWLRSLIPDINLAYLSGYYKLDSIQVISSSFRYFSLGSITFTNYNGAVAGQYNPYEFAFDAGYSRLLTDNLSAGAVFRFIYSNLTNGQNTADGRMTKAGISFAVDLGFLYRKAFTIGRQDALWAAGINISNLGTPISYTVDADKTPIPSNLRIGLMGQYYINKKHSVSLMADMNKLLVPTPPVYFIDTTTGDEYVAFGKEPRSIAQGIFQSFNDAPGYVMSDGSRNILLEELYEIMFGFGFEYQYSNFVALRAGYSHEHATKGNRKYITIGAGVSLDRYSFDLSYLIPTNDLVPHPSYLLPTYEKNSPLSNTYRFTLSVNFGRIKKSQNEEQSH